VERNRREWKKTYNSIVWIYYDGMETYFGSITSHPPTQKKQIGRNKVGVLEAMEWNSFHSSLTNSNNGTYQNSIPSYSIPSISPYPITFLC